MSFLLDDHLHNSHQSACHCHYVCICMDVCHLHVRVCLWPLCLRTRCWRLNTNTCETMTWRHPRHPQTPGNGGQKRVKTFNDSPRNERDEACWVCVIGGSLPPCLRWHPIFCWLQPHHQTPGCGTRQRRTTARADNWHHTKTCLSDLGLGSEHHEPASSPWATGRR